MLKSQKETLEARLRSLEAEQERQEHELADLKELEEVSRLEALLHDDDEPTEKRLKAEKTANLEKELEQELAKKKNIPLPKVIDKKTINDIELPEEQRAVRHGFVICLLFNAKSPSEWSDEGVGGWREQMGGTAYADQQTAEGRLRELKKHFPEYPLVIRKR